MNQWYWFLWGCWRSILADTPWAADTIHKVPYEAGWTQRGPTGGRQNRKKNVSGPTRSDLDRSFLDHEVHLSAPLCLLCDNIAPCSNLSQVSLIWPAWSRYNSFGPSVAYLPFIMPTETSNLVVCVNCKLRKKKCDKARPRCGYCVRYLSTFTWIAMTKSLIRLQKELGLPILHRCKMPAIKTPTSDH